jgi:hypothetical protein
MRKTQKYHEGDWFFVPVTDEVGIIGIIARKSPSQASTLLGYFFKPTFPAPPSLSDINGFKSSNASEVVIFSAKGIRDGSWKIIGKAEAWDVNNWPMPNFVREDPLTKKRYEVAHDDSDPAKRIGERQIQPHECTSLSRDALWGHLAIQRFFAKKLGFNVPPLTY